MEQAENHTQNTTQYRTKEELREYYLEDIQQDLKKRKNSLHNLQFLLFTLTLFATPMIGVTLAVIARNIVNSLGAVQKSQPKQCRKLRKRKG